MNKLSYLKESIFLYCPLASYIYVTVHVKHAVDTTWSALLRQWILRGFSI